MSSGAANGFWLALQFMTRLPVGAFAEYSDENMAGSVRWYPAVGAVVGLVAAVIWWVAAHMLPAHLAALLGIAAAILVTGALHEDGLADTADGLGGHASRERALDIMRDSSLGTYAALALGVILGGKVLALAALPSAGWIMLVAHVFSRAMVVFVIDRNDYARSDGKAGFTQNDAPAIAAPALLVPLVAALLAVMAVGFWPALCGILGAWLAGALLQARVLARLGGYTGDTLGAVQQVSEFGFYLGVLAAL